MSSPQRIRARIEECRQDLARAEGETEALQREMDQDLTKLRKLLKCKPGKEKAAIKKLREKIAADQAKVEELLDRAEAVRDGESE